MLYIITGPPAVGKTTVCEKLSKNMKRSVFLEGDTIYNLIRGGYVSPWKENNHLDVFWDNITDMINNYIKYDYDIVFSYIILKDSLEYILNKFKNIEIKFVVLTCNEDIIINRDLTRPLDCQMGNRSIMLLNKFKQEGYNEDNILDTSNLTIEEVVDCIKNNNKFILRR